MNRGKISQGLADPPPDAVISAAADWLVARDRGLSVAQQAEFVQWLKADERHETVFDQLEQTWGMLAEVPVAAASTATTACSGRASSIARRKVRMVWFQAALAAAAAFAIAYVAWWRPAQALYTESMAIDVGEVQRLNLPDGSIVLLNIKSAVNVSYTASERRVRLLRGEARFDVAKDKTRPFIVEAGAVSVRAVGTVFGVRLESDIVEVLVTEGKVQVNDSANGMPLLSPKTSSESSLLVAGEKAVIHTVHGSIAVPPSSVITKMSAPEVTQTFAWCDSQLKFFEQPLSNIVAEFNCYNQHKLVIADPQLAAKRFGGTFPAHDYEGFVGLLEKEFKVVAERGAAETVLRLP